MKPQSLLSDPMGSSLQPFLFIYLLKQKYSNRNVSFVYMVFFVSNHCICLRIPFGEEFPIQNEKERKTELTLSTLKDYQICCWRYVYQYLKIYFE